MKISRNIKKYMIAVCALVFAMAIFFPQTGSAAWWKFGRNEDVPEIDGLKFNSVNAEDVSETLLMGKDDLVNGKVIIRGRAELGKGTVGKVEVTTDGGKTWKKAVLGDRGMFTFELTPQPDEEYEFSIKALSTTGKSNDVEDSTFSFMVSSKLNTDSVKKVFMALLRHYMAENHSRFMELVSPDFEGDHSALDDAITDDFRFFDSIRIEPNITRIIGFDNNFEVYFTFNRQLQAAKTGQLLRDAAATSVTFTRGGDSFQVLELASPLVFGVSNPSEVATGFTEESEGTLVIVVGENGQASLGEAKEDDLDGVDGVEDGEETLTSIPNNPEGFGFADAAVAPCPNHTCPGNLDFYIEQDMLWCTDCKIMEIGTDFDDVTSVPDQVYAFDEIHPQVGVTYAINLGDGGFAIIEFSQYDVNHALGETTATFRYKYNPSGNTF